MFITIIILFIESIKALLHLATTRAVGRTYRKTFYIKNTRYEIEVFILSTSSESGTLIYKSFPKGKRYNELWSWCDKLSFRNLKYVTETIIRIAERGNKNVIPCQLG